MLATGWKLPERFVAKGRDGKTDIYGVIFRPTNFDPTKKYPVIEQIYAGPQGSFVPKRFAALHRPQALAELGFIVVQIDGMGTNWRSKAFHDVCWKNLGDAGFPDRIVWMKAAAATDPAMDLTRVGIYGGSAGGQNALGGLLLPRRLLQGRRRPTAAATTTAWTRSGGTSCGWAGRSARTTPSSRTSTHAHKLQGKLLLTVGELDRNVDPASTMQVVNALIKADKDFELIVFPGAATAPAKAPTASAGGATSSCGTCSASNQEAGDQRLNITCPIISITATYALLQLSSRKNCTGAPGSPMKGRSTQPIWIPTKM